MASHPCELVNNNLCHCCTKQGKQCSRTPTHGNLCTQHSKITCTLAQTKHPISVYVQI